MQIVMEHGDQSIIIGFLAFAFPDALLGCLRIFVAAGQHGCAD